jgi:hypothetical protein
MPNKRSKEKLPGKIIRNYAFSHSVHTKNTRGTLPETVFEKTPEEALAFLKIQIPDLEDNYQIDLPQGVVLSNSRGEGFYDKPVFIWR